ncbi:STAS domain-containing protein [Nonomuraea dietziae]|uniref:STAS domain-containing protein n=1 Tax=Nonomuraea dietziae TaxID=65515 RepID=UPI0034115D7D
MEDAEQSFTLQVSISDHGYYTTVSARGALDRVSAPVFTAHVDAAWEWSDGPQLVLDLSGVTFCDFDGVAALASIARRLRDRDRGRVILAGVDGQLQRMLRRTGLITRFERRDSVEQAGEDLLDRSRSRGQMAMPGWPGSPPPSGLDRS